MKKILFTFYLLSGAIKGPAQTPAMSNVIGIATISNAGYQDSIASVYIYSAVTRTLINTNRFTVLDVAQWRHTLAEMERQKGNSFLEQKIVEKGKSLGAQILVIAIIKNTQTYSKKKRYGIRVDYDLRFLDVATDTVIACISFKCDGRGVYDENITVCEDNLAPRVVISWRRRRKMRYDPEDVVPEMSDTVKCSIRGLMIDAIESTNVSLNDWVRNKFTTRLVLPQVLGKTKGKE